jgi:molybdopterin synthase catalytic subunit
MQSSLSYVELTEKPLDITKYTAFVADDAAGAIATFTGVTRDNFQGKRVLRLEYEAYEVMAEKVMQVVVGQVLPLN